MPGFDRIRAARMQEARGPILNASSWREFLDLDPILPDFVVVLDASRSLGLTFTIQPHEWADVQSEALEAIDAPAVRWRWELNP